MGKCYEHEVSFLVDSMTQAFYDYMLLKSSVNNAQTAGCYDQFTIGWMVHLQKQATTAATYPCIPLMDARTSQTPDAMATHREPRLRVRRGATFLKS